jgi:hypothetical protein
LKFEICLIHFFGPDGSGKSTQADILVDFLNQQGFRAKKCWVRAPHTLAFVLWRVFVGIGFYRVTTNPFGIAVKLPAVDRNGSLRRFWSIIEFLGVLPILFRVHFSLLRGYKLVAERYVLDTITTVAYFINDIHFLGGTISRALLHFIPRNTLFVFLDADYETIYHRRAPLFGTREQIGKQQGSYGLVPESSIEPRDFIEFQRVAYSILSKTFNALVIDTSKTSIKDTSDMVLRYLGF